MHPCGAAGWVEKEWLHAGGSSPNPISQKRIADLQWKVLHGAFACNAVVSKTCFQGKNVTFSGKVFIYGVGYKKKSQKNWQLLNFVSGTVKLVIYMSKRNKVAEHAGQSGDAMLECD